MHLPVERKTFVGHADRLAGDPAVVLDPHGIVTGASAQVQRVVWRFADAPDARRERDDVPG
jgi:hypothetical protein